MNDAALGFGLKVFALTSNLFIVGFALAGGALDGAACPLAASGFFSSPLFLPLNGGMGWINMLDLGLAFAGAAVEGGAADEGAAAALGAGLLLGGWAPIARAWALAASFAARSRMAFWRSSSLARIWDMH